MATTKTFEGVPWDGRTAYEKWVEDDLGLDLHRGYAAAGLRKVAVKPWKERGISAAFYDMIGAESLAGMYVGEIAPGASTVPARQLCDEVIFVLGGRGTATVETKKGPMSFEWGPNSLFAIPLNHNYQLHNTSGKEPARFVSINTFPIVYNLFRDAEFVFGGCDWQFERLGEQLNASDSILYKPDAKHEKTAVNLYETTFVPDVYNVQRSSFKEKGTGNATAYFELAGSVISVRAGSPLRLAGRRGRRGGAAEHVVAWAFRHRPPRLPARDQTAQPQISAQPPLRQIAQACVGRRQAHPLQGPRGRAADPDLANLCG
jgi:mannose-6-phosphate isomerase-like protein (cupin superfamily)